MFYPNGSTFVYSTFCIARNSSPPPSLGKARAAAPLPNAFKTSTLKGILEGLLCKLRRRIELTFEFDFAQIFLINLNFENFIVMLQ